MKQYQKPALYALSLSANDALCYGCGVKTSEETSLNMFLLAMFPQLDLDGDGFFSKQEYEASGLFASSENCQLEIDYNGYCKFTSTDDNKIFTS